MELVLRGARIELRDGSLVRVRQGHHTDRDLLVGGFERPGRESRYRRFLTRTRDLGEKTVRSMTELDHHDHEALLLELIGARARDEGIRTFTALMLSRNREMMHLFERLGRVQIVGRAAGTVEIGARSRTSRVWLAGHADTGET